MENPTKHSVLIVDDDAMIRQVLRLILRESNYDVVDDVGDGDEGLAACKRFKPEVVCLDVNMPGTDGLTTLQKIKAELPNTIVIMVTSDSSADVVKQSIANGAAGFVIKPFNPAKVISSIEATIHKVKAANPR